MQKNHKYIQKIKIEIYFFYKNNLTSVLSLSSGYNWRLNTYTSSVYQIQCKLIFISKDFVFFMHITSPCFGRTIQVERLDVTKITKLKTTPVGIPAKNVTIRPSNLSLGQRLGCSIWGIFHTLMMLFFKTFDNFEKSLFVLIKQNNDNTKMPKAKDRYTSL